ncbi:MAG: 30S ribosomal protein S6 [Chitinispirillales bacterium]|jgi:small subunit ribosomal protein S6|nr:30S ribosomal protein S6 [Chitinispirillales bacterium]
MSKYETIVIFEGSLPADTIEKERKKIEDLLTANGNLVNVDEWGKKVLAYEINKKKTGVYVLFVYEYNGNAGKFINTSFKFNENIIRHLTVIYEDNAIIAPQKPESERAATDESDEEEED